MVSFAAHCAPTVHQNPALFRRVERSFRYCAITSCSLIIVCSRMRQAFKHGDLVEWNSEAGRVRGVIVKKIVRDIRFKGYLHHASKDEPQYIIKSDKTDHIAIHKGKALKHVKALARRAQGKKNSSRV
jgi:hypothetical protein